MLVVFRKDGGLCMSWDYRHLNKQPGKHQNHLPRIAEIFTDLHDAHCFISIELLMGYQQIPGRIQDRPKLAFLTQGRVHVQLYTLWPVQSPRQASPFHGSHFPRA